MNILIPARGGSKRIPNKNLQQIGGKSLLARTIQHAFHFGVPFVSSDSEDILEEARRYGAKPILRDKALCEDNTPTLPIWKRFAQLHPSKYTILMQCTSPYRNLITLKEDIQTMLFRKEESGFSGVVFGGFVHTYKDGVFSRCFPRVRTQEINSRFIIEDGSMYVAQMDALMEADDLFFGEKPFILRNDLALDIDEQKDLDLARWIWNAKE
jgi:CMP-N-acetylneuraminic acid synthetase